MTTVTHLAELPSSPLGPEGCCPSPPPPPGGRESPPPPPPMVGAAGVKPGLVSSATCLPLPPHSHPLLRPPDRQWRPALRAMCVCFDAKPRYLQAAQTCPELWVGRTGGAQLYWLSLASLHLYLCQSERQPTTTSEKHMASMQQVSPSC